LGSNGSSGSAKLRTILKNNLFLLVTAESVCILRAETVDLLFYQFSLLLSVPLALLAGAFTVVAPAVYRRSKNQPHSQNNKDILKVSNRASCEVTSLSKLPEPSSAAVVGAVTNLLNGNLPQKIRNIKFMEMTIVLS
jgi:hypothetical protein